MDRFSVSRAGRWVVLEADSEDRLAALLRLWTGLPEPGVLLAAELAWSGRAALLPSDEVAVLPGEWV
jgi:hypothetical protein